MRLFIWMYIMLGFIQKVRNGKQAKSLKWKYKFIQVGFKPATFRTARHDGYLITLTDADLCVDVLYNHFISIIIICDNIKFIMV